MPRAQKTARSVSPEWRGCVLSRRKLRSQYLGGLRLKGKGANHAEGLTLNLSLRVLNGARRIAVELFHSTTHFERVGDSLLLLAKDQATQTDGTKFLLQRFEIGSWRGRWGFCRKFRCEDRERKEPACAEHHFFHHFVGLVGCAGLVAANSEGVMKTAFCERRKSTIFSNSAKRASSQAAGCPCRTK